MSKKIGRRLDEPESTANSNGFGLKFKETAKRQIQNNKKLFYTQTAVFDTVRWRRLEFGQFFRYLESIKVAK